MLDEGPLRVLRTLGWFAHDGCQCSILALGGVFGVLVLPGPLEYIFSRQRADGLVHVHPLGPAPHCPWGS